MLLQPFVSNVLLFMYEWWRNSYTLHNSKPYRYLWDIFFGTTTLLCVTLLSHFLFFHCTLHLSSTLKCTGLRWPVFLPCATLACKVVIFLGKLSLKTGFKLNPPRLSNLHKLSLLVRILVTGFVTPVPFSHTNHQVCVGHILKAAFL